MAKVAVLQAIRGDNANGGGRQRWRLLKKRRRAGVYESNDDGYGGEVGGGWSKGYSGSCSSHCGGSGPPCGRPIRLDAYCARRAAGTS